MTMSTIDETSENCMADLDLPATFRSELVPLVLNIVRAGESCSLVGVGSVGKSNVGRHLCRRDVLAHYLGDQARCVLGVLVNCLDLSDYTALSLHRLMLHTLTRAAEPLGLAQAVESASVAGSGATRSVALPEAAARSALDGAIAAILRAGVDRLFFPQLHLEGGHVEQALVRSGLTPTAHCLNRYLINARSVGQPSAGESFLCS
jgi:hypothetical protein